MLLDVVVMNPQKVVFEGKAKSVQLPGEEGVFEVLPFHKPIVSRLISGTLSIDSEHIFLMRGVVKVAKNKVTVIIEEE